MRQNTRQKRGLFAIPLPILILFSFLVSFSAFKALAAESLTTTQAHSTATFVFNQNDYQPGEKILAGLWIELEKDWHTYWLNPGDSGAPVDFAWKLPPGWKASSLQFAPPLRIPTPPLETFGYENAVLFFAELSAPSTAQGPQAFELEAEWLVCKNVCIPAVHTFSAELSSSTSATPSVSQARFQKAQLEVPREWSELASSFKIKGTEVELSVLAPAGLKLLDVFPEPKSFLSNKAPEISSPQTQEQKQLWTLKVPLSRLGKEAKSQEFLIKFEDPTGKAQFAWSQPKETNNPLLPFLFFAFIGGLLLNLMPCVFPILSIKFFSILKHSGANRSAITKANGLYVAGVLTSFWALAVLIFALRESGEALGWGFQLQSPGFVIFLILLFVLMAFNFLGWFEVDVALPGMGKLLQKEGPAGHFLTGVLSTVVASPCTAPFMGVSIGFALSQPLEIMLLIFTCLGLGLSFPYILLSLVPGWAKLLPKPGAWMEKLKTFMAFPLFATVIWLAWSLSFQISATSLALVWASVLLLGFMIWASKNLFPKSPRKNLALRIFLFVFVIWLSFFNIQPPSGAQDIKQDGGVAWQKFSPEEVEKLRAQNLPVFVDFTAAWCITCQVNKQVTFQDAGVQAFIKEHKIQMFLADWTNRDPVISEVLKKYERAGVPLYLFFPAATGSNAHILPEVLTPDIFKKNILDHL